MRRRLLPLLAAWLLAMPSTAWALVHVCHGMGVVVAGDCGCQKRHAAGHAAHDAERAKKEQAELKRQRCCEVQTVAVDAVSAGPQGAQQSVDEAKLALAFVSERGRVVSGLAEETALCRERGPPRPTGPPIFKRNCSYLN